jgi:hypothetical protein
MGHLDQYDRPVRPTSARAYRFDDGQGEDAVFLARQPRAGVAKAAYSPGLSFSCAWLPGAKNPGLFSRE